jgi:molybdenum cofactor cytidylyltransferase
MGVYSSLAVVLAAGRGSRFTASTHKLLADLDGRTVVERSVTSAVEASIGPVLVVAGAVSLPASLAEIAGVRVLHHPRWSQGQASSLQCAIAEARRLGASAVVVGLGDQPSIEPSAWRAVATAPSPIAIATYAGLPRNPVRLHRSVWDQLPTTGDEGARVLMRVRPDLVQQVPCQGSPADIDTTKDLAQWQSRSSTNSQ